MSYIAGSAKIVRSYHHHYHHPHYHHNWYGWIVNKVNIRENVSEGTKWTRFTLDMIQWGGDTLVIVKLNHLASKNWIFLTQMGKCHCSRKTWTI